MGRSFLIGLVVVVVFGFLISRQRDSMSSDVKSSGSKFVSEPGYESESESVPTKTEVNKKVKSSRDEKSDQKNQLATTPKKNNKKSGHFAIDGGKSRIARVKRAIFIHIPKGGGSFATTAIRSVLGCYIQPCILKSLMKDVCSQFWGCFGHEPLNSTKLEIREKGGDDVMLVTNMRNPADRVISAFHHGQRAWPCCGLNKGAAFRARIRAGEDKYSVQNFSREKSVSNCVTKMMIGRECYDERPVKERDYNQASANLQKFNMIFLQEYMMESMHLLTCITGDPLDNKAFTIDVRKGSYNSSSDEIKALISERNQWDVKLYKDSIILFCKLYVKNQCNFSLQAGLCPDIY